MYSLNSFVKFLPDRSGTMASRRFPDGALIITCVSPCVAIAICTHTKRAVPRKRIGDGRAFVNRERVRGYPERLRNFAVISRCVFARLTNRRPARDGWQQGRLETLVLSRETRNQDRKTFPSLSFLSSVTIFSRASLAPSLDSHARIALLPPRSSPRAS